MMRRWSRPRTLALLGLLVANLLVGLALYDKGLVMTEEGQILTEAAALLDGAVLYRDIDCWVTPGVWVVTAGVLALSGPSLDATRVMMLVLSMLTTALVFLIAAEVAGWRWGSFAAVLMLVQRVLAFPLGTFVFYTEFAVLFTLGTAWLLLRHIREPRSLWLALAGVSAGLAFLFKQNIGLALIGLSGVSVLVRTRKLGDLWILAGAVMGTLVPVVLGFGALGALPALMRGVFIVPLSGFYGALNLSYLPPLLPRALTGLERYHYLPSLFSHHFLESPFPGFAERWLPLLRGVSALAYALPIVIAIALGGTVLRRRRSAEVLVTIAGAALASFAGVFPRADFVHLAQGTVGLLPLGALLLQQAESRVVRASALVLAGAAVVVCGLLLAHMPFTERLDHPRAHVALAPREHAAVSRTLAWMRENIPADAAVMVAPHEPMYYFLSGRPVPHRYTLTLSPNIAFDGGRDVVEKMHAADVRFVVQPRYVFPGSPPLAEFGPALYDVLQNEFEVVFRISDPFGEHLRILRRKERR
ncbi:MAG: ArnT family glycosyltransferase [Myxococcota bacterium]